MLNEVKNEKGQITIYFLLFIGVVLAALNYSMTVARVTTEKIEDITAGDLAAKTLTDHSSAGFNLISTNNIAVGAALHISASTQFISRYQSILKTLSYGQADTNKLDKVNFMKDQDPLFEEALALSGHLTESAKSITTFNKEIVSNWLQAGANKAYESYKLNKAGSLPIITVGNKAAGDGDLHYQRLNLSSLSNAFCHTIKSSRNMVNRNKPSIWLEQIYKSMNGQTNLPSKVDALESGTKMAVANGESSIKTQLSHYSVEFNAKCRSWENKNMTEQDYLWCKTYAFWSNNNIEYPFPEFENCGLNYGGDLAGQSEFFATNEVNIVSNGNGQPRITFCHINPSRQGDLMTAQPSIVLGHLEQHPEDYLGVCRPNGGNPEEFDIGFIYPDINSLADYDDFQRSLHFSILSSSPLLNEDEIKTTCPQGLKDTKTGVCTYNPSGYDVLFSPHKEENLWQRSNWSYSESKSVYSPSGNDPQEAIVKDPNNEYMKARMQMFWPSWTSRKNTPEMLPRIISELKSI
ncbi:MAG: hypothetical protein EP319_02300 [Deltaproteobacteria bacterium]|nr:MAG: hypothetical protein EP319_02300 [Deltaproteobacteria bacterium]